MQCSQPFFAQCSQQPFFAAGPPNCLQFYPCFTPPQPQNCQMYQTYTGQTYNGPFQDVIGEGEVSSYVLPDGTVQLFFRPTASTSARCGRCMQAPNGNSCWNNNSNGAWFIRSVNKNQNIELPYQPLTLQPFGGSTYNQNNCMALPPCPGLQTNQPMKFHNDRCTSTEDIAYFCQRLQQKCEIQLPPSRSAAGVQVPQERPCCVGMVCSRKCKGENHLGVCHAPRKCPPICAGVQPAAFEGFVGRCDSDMSVDEYRRGQKRRKRKDCDCASICSICSACEKNKKPSKKRKYSHISSSPCSSCESLSSLWQEEEKRQKKAREACEKQCKKLEQQRKQREMRNKYKKQYEKHKKQCEKQKKKCEKQEKKYEKQEKKFEEQRKRHEKQEKRRRENAIKKCRKHNNHVVYIDDEDMNFTNTSGRSTCDRHMNQLRINEPLKICQQTDTNTSDTSCSLMCRLGSAINNIASSITNTFSSSTCGTTATSTSECPVLFKPPDYQRPNLSDHVVCPKASIRECSIICDKGSKKCEAIRKKSEKEFNKIMKAEQKRSEKELKRLETERKKFEKECKKKIKKAQKLREKEQRKREHEQRKREKHEKKQLERRECCEGGKYGKGDESTSKCYPRQPGCCEDPLLLSRGSYFFQDPCLATKRSYNFNDCAKGDKETRSRKLFDCPTCPSSSRQTSCSPDPFCRQATQNQFNERGKDKKQPDCTCPPKQKYSFHDSCLASRPTHSRDSPPLTTRQSNCYKDISLLNCRCKESAMSIDNKIYSADSEIKCNKMGPVKISEHPRRDCSCFELAKPMRLEQGNSCIIDVPTSSRKHCGVFCEGPVMANKQSATHTEQANSGIFSDIMKKLGIGVQCIRCHPDTPPRPPPPCEVPSQVSFEFVTCCSDENSDQCANKKPPCNPL